MPLARAQGMTAWIDPPRTGAEFAARMAVGEGEVGELEAYLQALGEWNARMNLVGPSAQAQFWPRHAFDSAQLRLIAPTARIFVDIGAGAGFPGVVLAILLKRAGGHVHLIESQGKRCRFLQAVVSQLDLPATVHHARAETGPAIKVDVVTARACAPLTRLLGYARNYLVGGARGLFLKGRNAEAELAEAREAWRFTARLAPSLSDREGRVVSIEGLSRA